ncbi:tripartite tricarboxylate transporter substrate binding protein [Aureimonas sp. AU12]|uniref:tripartite tricarboxylate transporter substrate binding protein n=1 Tax=Aureimonas sp. AU12 TaxID=1638161 RepID=UPI000781A3C5|nr:tripartite tricarboxylate transporter substrate-binding protein [Aureimonas sp. AU12]
MNTRIAASLIAIAAATLATSAQAQWAPSKPIEFIAAGGAGGGTDQFARQIQAAIAKANLTDENVVVANKGGGSGAEAFIYGKGAAGDDHKLIFGTSNEWTLPLVTKLGFQAEDLTPVAALALDEFIVWVQADAPYKTIMDLAAAGKENPGKLKFGGSQSKDVDQTLLRQIENATGAKFVYIPFKSGSEAAVQLAGNHIDGNTNNPAENVGQWRAGQAKPLCVVAPQRMAYKEKVTETMSWNDIPTCKEQGLALEGFQMPRTVFAPKDADPQALAYYTELLKKASETPEFQNYLKTTSQTSRFMTGDEFKSFIAADLDKSKAQFAADGWLAK